MLWRNTKKKSAMRDIANNLVILISGMATAGLAYWQFPSMLLGLIAGSLASGLVAAIVCS